MEVQRFEVSLDQLLLGSLGYVDASTWLVDIEAALSSHYSFGRLDLCNNARRGQGRLEARRRLCLRVGPLGLHE